jgi:hypothetical protein
VPRRSARPGASDVYPGQNNIDPNGGRSQLIFGCLHCLNIAGLACIFGWPGSWLSAATIPRRRDHRFRIGCLLKLRQLNVGAIREWALLTSSFRWIGSGGSNLAAIFTNQVLASKQSSRSGLQMPGDVRGLHEPRHQSRVMNHSIKVACHPNTVWVRRKLLNRVCCRIRCHRYASGGCLLTENCNSRRMR